MYCIIVNPNAGKGKGKKNLKTVLKLFSERGAEYSVFETTRAGEAKEFSERLTSSGEQEIIVVGGDGTLHEVLNGLSDPSSCRLGLIPSGTGNDFSAAAGLPSKRGAGGGNHFKRGDEGDRFSLRRRRPLHERGRAGHGRRRF